MTFATAYSGVGGADYGFRTAGWDGPKWQIEIDPYRQDVLRRHFGCLVHADIGQGEPTLADQVDVLYAELPDWQLSRWWPPLWRLAQEEVRQWFLCELSPTVRADALLRDLALADWAFRLMYVDCSLSNGETAGPNMGEIVDHRYRSLLIASRDGEAVDGIGLSGGYIKAILGTEVTEPEGSIGWREQTRGLRLHWTCACGGEEDGTGCGCDERSRITAAQDAECPMLCQWFAHLVDGRWGEPPQRRNITEAGGASCA